MKRQVDPRNLPLSRIAEYIKVMEIRYAGASPTERPQYAIGRLQANSGWRAADRELGEVQREAALRKLVREAEEYDAHGLVEVSFRIEECDGVEVIGVKLRRVVAVGRAVRFALAA